MVGENTQQDVVEHLHAALDAEETDDKDFHVRQALQLLKVDGEEPNGQQGG